MTAASNHSRPAMAARSLFDENPLTMQATAAALSTKWATRRSRRVSGHSEHTATTAASSSKATILVARPNS
eukprot:1606642-Pyramimonas_sp.AAC.1